MSPFDPMAILDEIQRLVPGYDVSGVNLLSGNDQHTHFSQSGPGAAHKSELIRACRRTSVHFRHAWTLFGDFELGDGKQNPAPSEVAAD